MRNRIRAIEELAEDLGSLAENNLIVCNVLRAARGGSPIAPMVTERRALITMVVELAKHNEALTDIAKKAAGRSLSAPIAIQGDYAEGRRAGLEEALDIYYEPEKYKEPDREIRQRITRSGGRSSMCAEPGHTMESLNNEREHYRERAHKAEAENKRLREARERWKEKFREMQEALRNGEKLTAEDLAIRFNPIDP